MKVLDNVDKAEDLYIQFLSSTKANWDATLAHLKVMYKGILPSKGFLIA